MLVEQGLNKRYSLACNSWISRRQDTDSSIQHFRQEEMAKAKPDETAESELAAMVRLAIVQSVTIMFP